MIKSGAVLTPKKIKEAKICTIAKESSITNWKDFAKEFFTAGSNYYVIDDKILKADGTEEIYLGQASNYVCVKTDGSSSSEGGSQISSSSSWVSHGDKQYKVLENKVSQNQAKSDCGDTKLASTAFINITSLDAGVDVIGLDKNKQYWVGDFYGDGVKFFYDGEGWKKGDSEDDGVTRYPVCMK